jgi:hypothetical protein
LIQYKIIKAQFNKIVKINQTHQNNYKLDRMIIYKKVKNQKVNLEIKLHHFSQKQNWECHLDFQQECLVEYSLVEWELLVLLDLDMIKDRRNWLHLVVV